MTDVIRDRIIAGVLAGVKNAVASSSTNATGSDTNEITRAVVAQVGPIVTNATNSEPWYQSRVTLGALLAAASGILGIFGYALPEEVQGKVLDAVIAAAPLISAAVVLYGRWVAKKPIGE